MSYAHFIEHKTVSRGRGHLVDWSVANKYT